MLTFLRRSIGFVCLALACACGAASASASTGGIVGTVLIGPMCPVSQTGTAGTACADQPYPATIVVQDQTGKRVAQVQADASGQFKLNLAPGVYTLVPQSRNAITHAGSQNVTVSAGQYTRVTINYDSGIR
jgi:hypothetical protein